VEDSNGGRVLTGIVEILLEGVSHFAKAIGDSRHGITHHHSRVSSAAADSKLVTRGAGVRARRR
jgi:hypothetical protein